MIGQMPCCPYCGGATRYGNRDSFSLAMGETPIDCTACNRFGVGYRDHDHGDFVMDRGGPPHAHKQ